MEIVRKRMPIEQLLAEGELPGPVAEQLSRVRKIQNFAVHELGLPDNGSYRYYADLGRDYVVWNVFATPELSLQNREWCYLIVGCLSYRGYFSEAAARELAEALESEGYDVFVGGVSAYSTLGWFADPVLNTMLHRGETYLARVIFHELAHQKIYIKNDTDFNEAFADTVALAGMQRWLASQNDNKTYEAFMRQQSRESGFVDLVLRYRQLLDNLYRSPHNDQDKRARKNLLLQQMVNDYQAIRNGWENDVHYDSWFARGVNNAKLVAVATYRQYVPGFNRLLEAVDNDLDVFYRRVNELAQCSPATRKKILLSGTGEFSC